MRESDPVDAKLDQLVNQLLSAKPKPKSSSRDAATLLLLAALLGDSNVDGPGELLNEVEKRYVVLFKTVYMDHDFQLKQMDSLHKRYDEYYQDIRKRLLIGYDEVKAMCAGVTKPETEICVLVIKALNKQLELLITELAAKRANLPSVS